MATNPTDLLGMSDEEFLKMGAAPEGAAPSSDEPNPEDPKPAEQPENKQDDPTPEVDPAEQEQKEVEEEKNPLEESNDPKPVVTDDEPKPEGEKKPEADPVGSKEGDPKPDDKPKTPETPAVDYKSEYDRALSGFKANGKTFKPQNMDELIKLAQMGANYTKRMQDLQPHRKLLTMLQNSGLTDENEISFLIDLKNKNPEAIKKLLKDANIDPLGIDMDTAPAYREGNHRVTDEEVRFRTALEDLQSTDEGLKTLQAINSTWDDTSKEALFKNPQMLAIMNEQRELGVYDTIVAEIDRQKTLGTLDANTPFLQAYTTVGDRLSAEAKAAGHVTDPVVLKDPVKDPKPATPIARTVATPVETVDNGDKATKAASPRTTPRTAAKVVNPLSMPDDEFLKQFSGRL